MFILGLDNMRYNQYSIVVWPNKAYRNFLRSIERYIDFHSYWYDNVYEQCLLKYNEFSTKHDFSLDIKLCLFRLSRIGQDNRAQKQINFICIY